MIVFEQVVCYVCVYDVEVDEIDGCYVKVFYRVENGKGVIQVV